MYVIGLQLIVDKVREIISQEEFDLIHLKENMMDDDSAKELKQILQLIYDKIFDLKLTPNEGCEAAKKELQKINED